MIISKAVVIEALRERGQDARAAFVDRELPERIDSLQHGGLLAMLHLNLADLPELAEAAAAAEPDETEPVEGKTAETEPAESKQAEGKPAENKPAEGEIEPKTE